MDTKACQFGQDQVDKMLLSGFKSFWGLMIFTLIILTSCQSNQKDSIQIVTADLNRFQEDLKAQRSIETTFLKRPSTGLRNYLQAHPSYKNSILFDNSKIYQSSLISQFDEDLPFIQSTLEGCISKLENLNITIPPIEVVFIVAPFQFGAVSIDHQIMIPIHLLYDRNNSQLQNDSFLEQLFVHEIIHTVQKIGWLDTFFGESLPMKMKKEGSAEFLTYLLLGNSLYQLSPEENLIYQSENEQIEHWIETGENSELVKKYDPITLERWIYFYGFEKFQKLYQNTKDNDQAIGQILALEF